MHRQILAFIASEMIPGEPLELRTVDGKCYVWIEPQFIRNEDGDIIGVMLPRVGFSTLFIDAESIIVANVIHDLAGYRARTGSDFGPG